ncbi:uncharacterized protein KY384_004604 [Bacidia gigantensis]|uniref:uncharacterized protein n=1 Tax=Bacidia gigantensis TaxID=2732470 RepID=UPI001D059DE9|nr:uncharacterized protein KY384_004604 [Bacidia gigantensis]KAG8531246.1 hypothetical protein KY384_004604 [Bacidia gigantensis]
MALALKPHAAQRVDAEAKLTYTESWLQAIRKDEGNGAAESHKSPHSAPLSVLYQSNLDAFRFVCYNTNQTTPDLSLGISSTAMRDELARFQLWGDEVALEVVDRVLDQADDLKTKILQYLVEIGRLLEQARDFKDSSIIDKHPVVTLPHELKQHSRCKRSRAVSETASSDESDNDSSDEAGDLPDDIGFQTKCLLELTPTIQCCIERNQNSNLQAVPAQQFTVSGPAYYYVQVVGEKFKDAPKQLVERLGEANWQRHNRLRQVETGQPQIEINDTSTVKPKSVFNDSGIGTTETGSLRYAASVQSHSSFISSNATGDINRLRVPSAPEEVKRGVPFSCKYCGQMQYKIKNRVDWK